MPWAALLALGRPTRNTPPGISTRMALTHSQMGTKAPKSAATEQISQSTTDRYIGLRTRTGSREPRTKPESYGSHVCLRLARVVNMTARRNPARAPSRASLIETLLKDGLPFPPSRKPVYAMAKVQET